MFSLSKKLDTNLRDILNNNDIEYYRVLIKYKTLQDSISKKISSYKGQIIRKIESCNIICAKLNSKSIYRLIEYPEIEFSCLDEYFSLCGMSIPTANKIRISNKL
ncbi:MAG: peptidase, partial [Clostridium celatum]|nr:peptidase [Clostridium celatum]